jgi:hypothetical protein
MACNLQEEVMAKITSNPSKSLIQQNMMGKLKPTKEEAWMASPSRSNRLKWSNHVQITFDISMDVKGKLEPTK